MLKKNTTMHANNIKPEELTGSLEGTRPCQPLSWTVGSPHSSRLLKSSLRAVMARNGPGVRPFSRKFNLAPWQDYCPA